MKNQLFYFSSHRMSIPKVNWTKKNISTCTQAFSSTLPVSCSENVHRLAFRSVVIFKFIHNNFMHLKLQSWIQFHNSKFQFSNFCVGPKEYSFCCDCWGWMQRYVHRGHNDIVRVKAEESWKFNCTNKVVKLRFQSNK